VTRNRIRVAICGDFPEEGWPSMDRFRAMLLEQVGERHGSTFDAASICPAYTRRATRIAAGARAAVSVDRFCNRFWDYPRHLRRIAGGFDLFHVVDHSYAHLVHVLPADRTIVTCHDVDAFRSVVAPDEEHRSRAFRFATRRILAGLQRAAAVTCVTAATERNLLARGILPRERTLVVHPGVADVFRREPDSSAERAAASLAGGNWGAIDLLHVGSTIPRKRIDVLLRVCGAARSAHPSVRLLRVGGRLTLEQRDIARRAGLADDRIVEIGAVDDPTLAVLYRRATIVLQPSEREGFGLPLAEALASGTPIVASDIDALREVGGDAAEYCPVGEVEQWTATIDRMLCEHRDDPARWEARRARGRARAEMFTWSGFADRVAALYESLAVGSARHIA
jgi:glycosyltransferase involved in cell wall biosynthesis